MPDQPSTEDITVSTETDEPSDFAAFILALGKGKPHRELSEAVRDISKQVLATGKAGKIQLTLHFKPQKNVEGALLITDDIKSNTPRFDRPASIFYADDDGDLHRNDPRQQSLY